MRFLLCFDLTEDKRRNKFVDLILQYGSRCQYSVFELNLNPPLYRQLKSDLNNFPLAKGDKLYIYPIPAESSGQIIRKGPYSRDEDVYVF